MLNVRISKKTIEICSFFFFWTSIKQLLQNFGQIFHGSQKMFRSKSRINDEEFSKRPSRHQNGCLNTSKAILTTFLWKFVKKSEQVSNKFQKNDEKKNISKKLFSIKMFVWTRRSSFVSFAECFCWNSEKNVLQFWKKNLNPFFHQSVRLNT